MTRNSAAAGAGGNAEDPYKVLGVKEGTPGDELAKVINRKKLLYKTEPEKLKQMEDAYEQIVQASLAARLRGDMSGVPSRLARRPRAFVADLGADTSEAPLKDKKEHRHPVAAALRGFTQDHRTIQPIIYATIFHAFRMFMKLVDVDPGPSANIDRDAATKHNNKRFFRAFALVMGTFAVSLGITYWIPNMIFETFRLQVPVWYLLNQEVFVSVIVGGCLAYLTCFYR